MQHACLVELDLDESEFQSARAEGALGNRDASWPRVDAIYEAEQPLDFDLMCRMGATAQLVAPDRVVDSKGKGARLSPEDLTHVTKQEYLPGSLASRNVYLHLCFDRTRPSRVFCGLFAPTLAEGWAYFGGIDAAEGDAMRSDIEQLLAEQLAAQPPPRLAAQPALPESVQPHRSTPFSYMRPA
jgi:hypothetical protein